MGRSTAPEVAQSAQNAPETKGVRVHLNTVPSPHQAADYDLVLVAVGAQANDELAVDLGLCSPGYLQADKDGLVQSKIYAIGDVAIADHDFLSIPQRLESVDQAVYSAKCAAAHILGQPRPPAAAPWFWSFQGDWKLQMVGQWPLICILSPLADRQMKMLFRSLGLGVIN